jgi:hypothetical protein
MSAAAPSQIPEKSLWRCKASQFVHRVIASEPHEIITWSLGTSVLGQGETFLGDRELFLDTFEALV